MISDDKIFIYELAARCNKLRETNSDVSYCIDYTKNKGSDVFSSFSISKPEINMHYEIKIDIFNNAMKTSITSYKDQNQYEKSFVTNRYEKFDKKTVLEFFYNYFDD